MALPGTVLVQFRALCNLGQCFYSKGKIGLNVSSSVRWYKTKARTFQDSETPAEPTKQGNPKLLKEFPEPKGLLNNAISRSLGVSDLSNLIQYHCTENGDVKKATVTVLWPTKIEVEGFASRRLDAERFAAAAACQKLKELGVLGPDNQLPRKGAGRGWGTQPSALFDAEEDPVPDQVYMSGVSQTQPTQPQPLTRSTDEDTSLYKALSMFPQPKALLARVIQVATSSNSFRELVQYKTTGGKTKRCELTVRWPENLTFVASAGRRVEAEKRASALACLKLKEMELLDQENNPLTHARYHKEQVREAGAKDRRPYPLEIPEYLQDRMREYLAEYPVALEVKRLWEEEEERAQRRLNQQDREEEDDLVTDAITGRPHRPLSASEAEELSVDLQEQWERASPRPGVELPVDAHRERVLSEVEASRVVVIAGETGCGKTTRVPRFLLEGRVRGGQGADCNILVTQPRRISAVSVAQRVAQEMGPALKHSVGYQVRLESRPPEHSGGALLFLTVGVLLRKLQGNASLRGVSHVVVDEVHERDVNTDLLLALLRSALRDNPRLRLVLMSATGDNVRLAQYFGGCPVVKVPGFMHPVQDRYLEEVLKELGRPPPRPVRANPEGREPKDDATPNLDLVTHVIEHIHRHGEPGAVLCFLPGWQDIKAVQERLEERPAFRSASHAILPLHSSMSVADQQAVFQRPPEGRRKIVLATNIAETSITIDDIVHVVDSGSHKEQNYDPRTKVSCLDTVWVSRSNITQRRGRAGRCQPGHSYHLFPKARLETMSHFPVPEILRTPLESLVVQAKIHSPHLTAVDFLSQVLDSPEEQAVIDAVRNLQEIGVLDTSEALTPLGERVACMSCDPRLGKVLVLAAVFRCVLPLLSVAACLTRDPFHNSMQNRALVSKSKKALSGSSHSDYLALSRAVAGWKRVLREGGREDKQDYLYQHTLSGSSLRFINGLTSQFSENLYEAQMVSASPDCQRPFSLYNQHSQQEELVKAVLLAGLYPNLIQLKRGLVTKGGRFRPNNLGYRTQSGPVHLHRSSVNRGREDLPSRWLTFFTAVKSSGQVFMRDSSSVHPLALLLFTDCDITERVLGDRVEVSFPGHSLFRCELAAHTWELLWELRTSIQTMVQRSLRARGDAQSQGQDGELLALLVELLHNTDSDSQQGDSEVD